MIANADEVSTCAVELVNEDHTGNSRVVSVAPVGLRLGLNTTRSAKYTYATVKNLEGAVNFHGEVNVAGGVNDVEAVFAVFPLCVTTFPETTGSSGLNSNTALLLLFHEVGGGFTIVNFTDFVGFTREFEDTFCGRCFTSVHVGEDTDVSIERKV